MPTPIIVFVIICSMAAVLSIFIRPDAKKVPLPPVQTEIDNGISGIQTKTMQEGLLAEDTTQEETYHIK